MKTTFSILLFVLVLFSCKKEVENPSKVYAGVENVGMYTKVYTPAKEITMTYDSQGVYATGKDSIDVDNDGVFDFTFYLNYFSSNLVGNPNPVPSFKMEFNDDILVCLDSVSVYIGLGAVTHFRYANCFPFDEQISFHNNWIKHSVDLWTEVPVWSTSARGEWYHALGKRYIGFHKGQKMGWIEIDVTNAKNPKIIAHSIQ